MADAYDLFLADLYGRPNTVGTREQYFAIYGDQIGPTPSGTQFLQGSVNYGQYGNVSSIAPDPFTGEVRTVRNPGPTIATENQNQGGAGPMVVYDPNLGWYTPATPLPPSMLTNSSGANLDLALGRSSGTGYNPTGAASGYNVANLASVNSLQGAQSVASLGAAACQFITNPALRAACLAAAGVVGGVLGGNGSGMPMGGMPMQNGGGNSFGVNCMPPRMQIGGVCVDPTAMLPGGDPFISPATGIFGAPSVAPITSSQRVLKCARGLVLGKDNRCYAKGSIPRNARKWKPEPKPLVSRSDVKALARINSIRGRVKKAAGAAGLSTKLK